MPAWLHLEPEQVGKGQEKKKINIVVLFRSYPTRNRKFQKNSKKKKIPLMHHFKPKLFGKGKEREKIKIIVSFRPYPTRNRKCKTKSKKIKKN